MQFQNNEKLSLGHWKRWPRPLNRGDRLIKVTLIVFILWIFRDFATWPLNTGWPLKTVPLNTGSAVLTLIATRVLTGPWGTLVDLGSKTMVMVIVSGSGNPGRFLTRSIWIEKPELYSACLSALKDAGKYPQFVAWIVCSLVVPQITKPKSRT